MSQKLIIIGAGQAAAQAIQSLRAEGFEGPITLIGDEVYGPYQRPPLSKAYLMGNFERERLFLKPDDFYTESNCELLLNARATAIHRAEKTVELSDGKKLAYVLGHGDLMLADADGKNAKRLIESWNAPSFEFSPDGTWIVYSLEDESFNDDIWLMPVDGSKPPFNLSRHPDDDTRPHWSPDGKMSRAQNSAVRSPEFETLSLIDVSNLINMN